MLLSFLFIGVLLILTSVAIHNQRFFQNPAFIFSFYLLAAAIACSAKILIDFKPHGPDYISKVNNFIIFKNSFFHLINHQSLYGPFPLEQYDLYKYSPTFALIFAPFALFPISIGAVLWAIFNASLLYMAVSQLHLPNDKKVWIHWFVLIELITSIQNCQVNPIIAALFVFTFNAFEKKQIGLAALLVVLSAYIKVYGVMAGALFLLYPNKPKFIAYSFLWGILLLLAPLSIISTQELIDQYKGWQTTITNDHETRAVDVSIMRFMMSIAQVEFNNQIRLVIQLIGVAVFCIKYARYKYFQHFQFRLLFLASLMIWSIIFNHLAESATYIIAVTGVAIWYLSEKQPRWALYLIISAFVLTELSPTDIFPAYWRKEYIVPYALKALPCILIWIWIEFKLIFGQYLIESKRTSY